MTDSQNKLVFSILFILSGLFSIVSFVYRSKPPEIESLSKIEIASSIPIKDETIGGANTHPRKQLTFFLAE